MKKRKGIWMALLTVILSVAMLMGTMSISAFADVTGFSGTPANSEFVRRVEYNKPTKAFKGATEVITPNGTSVTAELDEYTPLEVGVYTVKFGDYSYNVSCYLDGEYELRVDHDGADIATYMKAGTKLKIPGASVWVKTHDDKDFRKTNEVVSYKVVGISGAQGTAPAGNPVEVDVPSAATYTVHYYSRIGGTNGTKYLYKDYTVKAQSNFSDTSVPTLNVVNIPSTVSLNTKVTLPKATATDNYDENVKVVITVKQWNETTQKYEDVKEVAPEDVNEHGYATKEADGEVVKFDNVHNRSFYPTKATDYQITYTAYDDAGLASTGNHVYTTTATDTTAPLLVELDEESIPTSWGINSVTNGNETNNTRDPKLVLPRPTYVDNSGETPTVIFELTDPNGNTVIRFSDINDKDGNGAKYKYDANNASNGLYPDEVTFGDTLTLDLSKYADAIKDDSKKTSVGTYTVSYQARDRRPNLVTKTIDIKVEETFTDTVKPSITDLVWSDNYLLFTDAEEEFKLPSVVVTDNTDAHPAVTFTLFDGASDNEGRVVKSGETVKLVLKGEAADKKPTVIIEDQEDWTLTSNELQYTVKAVDDAGNEYEIGNRDTKDKDRQVLKVVNAGALTAVEDMTFTVNTTDGTKPNGDEVTKGERTNIGDFKFMVPTGMDRAFYGFELSIYTVKGNEAALWSNGKVSVNTYFTDGKYHVEDVTFSVPDADKVRVYFRAFNVAGKSTTNYKEFTVKDGNPGGNTDIESAIDVGTSGSVYTTYQLKNRKVSLPNVSSSKQYIEREIEGAGKFSLMGGSLFTAYNAGSFTFAEYYYDSSETRTLVDQSGSYDLTVTETTTPVWQMQDEMPTYVSLVTENNANRVTLPKMLATTEYANAKVDLKVTFAPANGTSNTTLTVAKTADENESKDVKIDANKQYYFDAKQDGTYTVTYTAYYGDGEQISQSFTIKAGDVVAPSFTVDSMPNARATENDVFKFSVLTLTSDETASRISYRKTLKAPDGTEVYTVSGRGETYRKLTTSSADDTTGYTMTKTGIYTVEYVVSDEAGNEEKVSYTINVHAAKVNNPVSTKIISTILIIVGVLLIAGVILYFVRFRKVKSK